MERNEHLRNSLILLNYRVKSKTTSSLSSISSLNIRCNNYVLTLHSTETNQESVFYLQLPKYIRFSGTLTPKGHVIPSPIFATCVRSAFEHYKY